jgi:hypothetical protein
MSRNLEFSFSRLELERPNSTTSRVRSRFLHTDLANLTKAGMRLRTSCARVVISRALCIEKVSFFSGRTWCEVDCEHPHPLAKLGQLTGIRPTRNDHVGHDSTLQAAHLVGKDRLGQPGQNLKARGRGGEGEPGSLVVGEADEVGATSREHRSKDVEGVNGEHATGFPHPWSTSSVVVDAPSSLLANHQTAKP